MYRQQIAARIAYLQAELSALAKLVELTEFETAAPVAAVIAAPQPSVEEGPVVALDADGGGWTSMGVAAEELPPEPEPVAERPAVVRRKAIDTSSWSIDPVKAAEILGVARQTVDRRIRAGWKKGTPGEPVNVSKGEHLMFLRVLTDGARENAVSREAVDQWLDFVEKYLAEVTPRSSRTTSHSWLRWRRRFGRPTRSRSLIGSAFRLSVCRSGDERTRRTRTRCRS